MKDFEGLGVFYLGRLLDSAGAPTSEALLYDSRDLTTHAVCIGMTGSGKTGLCLSLLEEAALDGVPAIAIDPKGDLGNLLLAFPDLSPADFRPWIDEGEAARSGIPPEELASKTAETWKKGLAAWGEDGERIRRLREAADFTIYTPGSTAGLPVSVLDSFRPPSESGDSDALQEKITATASGLLSLLGLEADPVKSRETILLSTILKNSWSRGASLDLAGLIRQVQDPPFDSLGVMSVESFYPAKERRELSLALNGLLASPGFSAWLEGEPLDVGRLLHTAAGKPRVSIFSIAHLSDAERMFFVTLLLNEVIAWMRRQSGTSSLRAILYMDEIFGFFPPTANPSSKLPLLTLMKQARAFGLGVVLATQNPVDLDYKGLSNAGTWILGRLQAERDKARVLEGLEGASAAAGAAFDRSRMEATLAGLKSRIFLLNNVHDDRPVLFESRWCMSYLRGPLTRGQIQTLMAPRKTKTTEADEVPGPGKSAPAQEASPPGGPAAFAERALLPAGIKEVFLRLRVQASPGTRLVYRPALLGSARLHFTQVKPRLDMWQEAWLLADLKGGAEDIWNEARSLEGEPALDESPAAGASFDPLPEPAGKSKSYQDWKLSLVDALYRRRILTIFSSSRPADVSRLGETEGDFRTRLGMALREKRDQEVEALRQRHAAKLAVLQDRIRRAEQRVSVQQSQYDAQKVQTAISAGATILGALFGRKTFSAGGLGKATTTARGVGRAAREREDVGRAEESLEDLRQQLADLQAKVESEAEALRSGSEAASLPLEKVELHPRKGDIQPRDVLLVWTPWEIGPTGEMTPRF
ncbi:MAG TPA: DUF87 domain-containing protein [Candidatus Polarisedimenticolia bacterium]|nr:DUF87 domain-containing protein [Candidatus Polarisedimenticolia bacterium]